MSYFDYFNTDENSTNENNQNTNVRDEDDTYYQKEDFFDDGWSFQNPTKALKPWTWWDD